MLFALWDHFFILPLNVVGSGNSLLCLCLSETACRPFIVILAGFRLVSFIPCHQFQRNLRNSAASIMQSVLGWRSHSPRQRSLRYVLVPIPRVTRHPLALFHTRPRTKSLEQWPRLSDGDRRDGMTQWINPVTSITWTE
ncbi:hypothetical protein SISNIDRAFT_346928 [Sistotremastrum niveocremeum HHB9708]|uniref:Uncharacterized protein n=1 Tax=Sistotremastrum niveocremeum HHB9708 TaxID=1314777 RepID=A0A164WUX3_9AGAM|nr:hypothetical protein SISNIDRAFT_346928 [Sistotremastrum niveocremeum HHB9708]